MLTIPYINRESGEVEFEQVYGERSLKFLYGPSAYRGLFSSSILSAVRSPLLSKFYGWLQKQPFTRRKILPFIKKYRVNSEEFLDEVSSFSSFNDFFIRKLKPSTRPIASGENTAVLPADGRYRFFPKLSQVDAIHVKGIAYSLERFLGSGSLAKDYKEGSLVLARLCPSDYHRFHFTCSGKASPSTLLPGTFLSVNPLATQEKPEIFLENRRMLSWIDHLHFGRVLCVEIGATCVGAIHQTYSPYASISKGDEKGYFSFGGSSIALLFPANAIVFAEDLKELSKQGLEILCKMGQPLGAALS